MAVFHFNVKVIFSAALTNLLNILADNEELSNLEQLVLDICEYITKVTAKVVLLHLLILLSENRQ